MSFCFMVSGFPPLILYLTFDPLSFSPPISRFLDNFHVRRYKCHRICHLLTNTTLKHIPWLLRKKAQIRDLASELLSRSVFHQENRLNCFIILKRAPL